MQIKVQKIHRDAILPSYAYRGDAGMDIYSCEEAVIQPKSKALIKTGVKIAIPEGYAGFVWDKSGLAVKHDLTTMAGVLDSGYRGELTVVIVNLGDKEYRVEGRQKIAQLVIKPVISANIVEVENIDNRTSRGEKRFGSSGLN